MVTSRTDGGMDGDPPLGPDDARALQSAGNWEEAAHAWHQVVKNDRKISSRIASGMPPGGTTPAAITFADGWIAVATADNRLLVYARDGTLLGEIGLTAP